MTKSIQTDSSLLKVSLEATAFNHPSVLLRRNNLELILHAPGVFEFRPNKPTSTFQVLLSCGIHGNETAPIEICDQLGRDLMAQDFNLNCPLMIIYGNLEAIKSERRFVTENLNRLFKDTPSTCNHDNKEQARAQAIKTCVDKFVHDHKRRLIHYDLHTAIRDSYYPLFAVSPYTQQPQDLSFHYRLLAACGIQCVLQSHKPSSTFSSFTASKHNAQAFTLELGKVRPFGSNPESIKQPVITQLRELLAGKSHQLSITSGTLKFFSVTHEIIKKSEHFRLYLDESTANFSQLPAQTLIAEDLDYQYRTADTSEYIVFPNPDVAIGHRAGLILRSENP